MRKNNVLRSLAPSVMPDLRTMLADLGHPTAEHVADLLGVNPRTFRRWLAAGVAPRPCMLALYWLTRWGRSQVECRAVNDARMAAMQARAALSQLEAATQQNAHLLRVGDFGSANSPSARQG